MIQPESSGLNASALARVQALLNRWIDAGRIAGAVVWVERRRSLALFEAFAMRKDSMFAEKGAVLLRDPVAKYLPRVRKDEGRPAGQGAEARDDGA